jgi:uncharacterized membrane protein
VKLSSKVILGALVIIGVFLRIYQIDFQCIWTEEAYTLSMAKLPFLEILTTFDFNPPLYYIFAKISYIIFNSDVSIRYPSVVFGILLIPLMYWLGREYKDELTGLYCAAFTTIVFPGIYFSQYARAYEMSVLAFVVLLICYIRIKREKSIEYTWADFSFWFMVIINAFTHFFVLIPIGLLCLDLLVENHKKWISPLFMLIFATSPIFGTLISILTNRSVASGVSYGANAIQMIVLTPMEFFNVLFLNICFLFGVGVWMDKDPLRNRLIVVTILTLIIGVICSCFTPFFPRYYMTVSMIILLFAAVACVGLSKYVPKISPILIFLLILIVFTIMTKDNYISHYTITQYTCGG